MPEEPPDPGLRTMMTWTLIALVISLIMTAIGVGLAIHYFDRP